MKQITLILTLLITLALSSCGDMGKKTNSQSCSDRFDVQLSDGGAIWIYNGTVYDGYVKGYNEMGEKVYIPMTQILSITEVSCDNGK